MKEKVLNWSYRFSTFCLLDNHQYAGSHHSVEFLVAAGVKRELKTGAGNALEQLDAFYAGEKSWLFGHLAYDLKNEIEDLRSGHPDRIGFPDLYFFVPEILVRVSPAEMNITAPDPQQVYDAILSAQKPESVSNRIPQIRGRLGREEYTRIISRLKEHILRGDCYEINFCQEFYAEQAGINPTEVYRQLSLESPNPFAALYRHQHHWLLCASPERYLQKKGDTILSQPIKGTAKRDPDPETDHARRQALARSAKDRSENVMVVDLVRNDLSRICEEGTVQADELFGIYSYPRVHQMISTVSGKLKKGSTPGAIIRATFPMGSMTGAPKKRVMELIEQYEVTKRGIFSGAVGYINPEGDMDFNVVIRSIMYNASTRYLSFQAGSAITFYSQAEQEWEECLLKAAAIKKVLENPV